MRHPLQDKSTEYSSPAWSSVVLMPRTLQLLDFQEFFRFFFGNRRRTESGNNIPQIYHLAGKVVGCKIHFVDCAFILDGNGGDMLNIPGNVSARCFLFGASPSKLSNKRLYIFRNGNNLFQ